MLRFFIGNLFTDDNNGINQLVVKIDRIYEFSSQRISQPWNFHKTTLYMLVTRLHLIIERMSLRSFIQNYGIRFFIMIYNYKEKLNYNRLTLKFKIVSTAKEE